MLKVYVTSYSVKGTRYNGTYLVKAESKKEANSIVKETNPEEYHGLKSYLIDNHTNVDECESDVMGCYANDFTNQEQIDTLLKQESKFIFLESGT